MLKRGRLVICAPFSIDFAHAYKHVGAESDRLDFATVVLRDPSRNRTMATLKTQPPGSSRSPANWARLAEFIQFAVRRLFLVWMGVFVGNVILRIRETQFTRVIVCA